MSYTRFALYAVPEDEQLAEFGARWLGWDLRSGQPADQFAIAGLHDVTMTPRKYGFHGTIKPPFRLAPDQTPDGLMRTITDLVAELPPAPTPGLHLHSLGGFLALCPAGPCEALARLAAGLVTELDIFRAPASEAELVRRRAAGLTIRQEAHLVRWGYPYVHSDFRFHFTLTGKLVPVALTHWEAQAQALLPDLPRPFTLTRLALVGERSDGKFETIHDYTFSG